MQINRPARTLADRALHLHPLDGKGLALLGKGGGKLAGSCDFEWIAPGEESDRIQEVHMLILHTLIEGVERMMYPANYR